MYSRRVKIITITICSSIDSVKCSDRIMEFLEKYGRQTNQLTDQSTDGQIGP